MHSIEETSSQLQNMNGGLYAWLPNQDPITVLRHFKGQRGLIMMV
jgi:hypothetical protein